jgi:hypothetical protein
VCTFIQFMFAHKISGKTNVMCGMCKEENFGCSNMTIHETFSLSFYTCHKKYTFLQTLFANIECPDEHATFPEFLIFLIDVYAINITCASTPMNRNTTSSICFHILFIYTFYFAICKRHAHVHHICV